jgi:hypothetical protein
MRLSKHEAGSKGCLEDKSRKTPAKEETMLQWTRRGALAAAAFLALGSLGMGSAAAQTGLKWAHVYEANEPYHKWALWVADEFAKRTENRYKIEVFPGLVARQGERHQRGPGDRHR